MNPPQGGVVIYAKDFQRVAAFYAQVAGLRVGRTAGDHSVLESGAFQLVVLRIPGRLAQTITLEPSPVHRENTPIKPVFFVESLAQARTAAVEYGGTLNDPGREWSFDGATVCDGCDPEGNVYQLRQPPPAGS